MLVGVRVDALQHQPHGFLEKPGVAEILPGKALPNGSATINGYLSMPNLRSGTFHTEERPDEAPFPVGYTPLRTR